MKLYLDTSTESCKLRIEDASYEQTFERGKMAVHILQFIHDKLQENGADWPDITEITYFTGPGSFTGLRIGAAIVNTLADQLQIPLYDQNGVKHQVILPDYGRPANISTPRK